MSILVFGAGGLLGSHLCALYPKDTIPILRKECDITRQDQVHDTLHKHKPKVVVNCAGVVKGQARIHPEWMEQVNAQGPQIIARECDELGIKLIHVSSDCVFGDHADSPTEETVPKAKDIYGRSKAAGEIVRSPHLTIRTAFIGWPDPNERGLLSWLFYRESPVPGYTHAFWNGLTTLRLAEWIVDHAHSSLDGLAHIFGQKLSKYQTLKLANHVFDWGKQIDPLVEPHIDRVLATVRQDTALPTETLEEMLVDLRKQGRRITAYLEKLH